MALSRGFDLPIGYFFTPPPPADDIGLYVPGAPMAGIDPIVLLDAVLGTPDNLEHWERELLAYSASSAPMPKSKKEKPSVSPSDLAERIAPQVGLRARTLVRRLFGEVSPVPARSSNAWPSCSGRWTMRQAPTPRTSRHEAARRTGRHRGNG